MESEGRAVGEMEGIRGGDGKWAGKGNGPCSLGYLPFLRPCSPDPISTFPLNRAPRRNRLVMGLIVSPHP